MSGIKTKNRTQKLSFELAPYFFIAVAIFTALEQQSMPIAEQFFLSFKTDVIKQPEPIPISNSFFFDFYKLYLKTPQLNVQSQVLEQEHLYLYKIRFSRILFFLLYML